METKGYNMSVNVAERVTISRSGPRTASTTRRLVDLGRGWMQMLRWRSALYRSRRDLRDLSDAQLRDIGITREDAAAEARRGFNWD